MSAAQAAKPPYTQNAPYVGLRPFREEDHEFFFGRDREIRVILSNLQRPLTVLYGPSGVGKSSILQAGVVPKLKASGAAVFYHNEWQSPDFAGLLSKRFEETLQQPIAQERLDDYLEASGRRVVVLLDQFEEYLLYHSEEGVGEEFDAALARIINRDDVAANVLIGIREDALFKLDQRFSIRIPELLVNTLAVQLLAPEDARRAITQPLRVLNERYTREGGRFEIEDSLVNRIIEDVQAGQVLSNRESAGAGMVPTWAPRGIETAYLQLVLRRLWDQETAQGSQVLRLVTLESIGGASQILRKHVDTVMEQFAGDEDRWVAARMFRYLVTPSGTKVAQTTSDLIAYAEAGGEEVRGVLSRLTDRPDARILRRLANPERYEIFHDVLAPAILDWRSRFFVAQEKADADRKRSEEAARQQRELEQAQALARAQAVAAGRLRWALGAVVAGLLVALALAIYAFRERAVAERFADLANVVRHEAETAKTQAQAAKAQADAERARAQAALAASLGDKELAARLTSEAAKSQSDAESLKKKADQDNASFVSAQQKLGEQEQKHAADVQDLRNQLAAAASALKQAQDEIAKLRSAPQPKEQPPQQQPNQPPVTGQRAGEARVNSKDGLIYVRVPAGKFTMGCSPNDKECSGDEPAHEVTISQSFWIGQTPVTQEAYQRVAGNNPSSSKGPRLPVERVTWDEAKAYCETVGMRLPTEAEWEYAARAGTTGARYGDLDQVAWHASNSGGRSHEVGQKQANAFGLYDMLGNVWEWLADGFEKNNVQWRVWRGGAWDQNPFYARVSYRVWAGTTSRASDLGFRCAGELP